MGTPSMQLGATESRDSSNRIYLNLRTGKLSETSKEPKPGFREFVSFDKENNKHTYYARTWDDLTVYVKDIKWSANEWQGKKIVGWNLILDAGDDKEYVLQMNSGDRPYQTMMQVLPNVDFNQPVRIVAFMGKNQKSQKDEKVFLLTQNPDRTAKDWVKPKYQPKWLSENLQAKLNDIYRAKKAGKQPIELTAEEAANVEYDEHGDIEYRAPYVKQNADGTWNFSDWTNFLIAVMNDEVIPAVEAAQAHREATATDFDFTGDDSIDVFDPTEGRGEDLGEEDIPWLKK